MLGKSVVSETHPLFVGLYEGAMGREEVTQFVEESDCVILLGTFMTDFNLGIYTANLDSAHAFMPRAKQLRIRHHHLSRRAAGRFHSRAGRRRPTPPPRMPPHAAAATEPITYCSRQAPITIRG